MKKMRKSPKTTQWQNYALPTNINATAQLPFNTKAPYLHTVSVFNHRELNSLKEMAKLLYIQPLLVLLYIVKRSKLSYQHDSYRTSGNTSTNIYMLSHWLLNNAQGNMLNSNCNSLRKRWICTSLHHPSHGASKHFNSTVDIEKNKNYDYGAVGKKTQVFFFL